MKKHHAPSFLFSIIVHILALFIFFYTYKYVVYLNHKKTEQKVCINLNLCIPEDITPIKKIKKVKKVKKVLPKKIVPKKVQKKKAKPKKVKPAFVVPVIKKELEKPKEIVEEILETKVIEEVTIKDDIEESNTTVEPVKTTINIAAIQEKQYINDNLAKISQLLSDNLYYPRRARKRGIVGEVIVRFNILQNGTVNAVKIISSNSEILSKAAKKTIKNLSGKFPKPTNDLTIQIPIEYSLK